MYLIFINDSRPCHRSKSQPVYIESEITLNVEPRKYTKHLHSCWNLIYKNIFSSDNLPDSNLFTSDRIFRCIQYI